VGGKYWHPKNGEKMPKNNTEVVLHEDMHERMKFEVKEDVEVDAFEVKLKSQSMVNKANPRLSG